ncbi:AmbAllergen [Cynara cardunculus var. scolymus]|uniref:Pectate lyase n=1 Tax=Cynara cardunculus var. scolymus TaxID=59895 RepID=A0A103XZW8_CYNCS|nr:AmbAllergen [Cynara cardunculus var. scolymus]
MGNHYSAGRHHRRNRTDSETVVSHPDYKYGPSPYNAPQIPANSNKMAALSLPYANVDCNLRALAGQAEGFGRLAVGGLHGSVYHVTTLSEAAEFMDRSNGLRWKSQTVDGRGQRIKLTGKGLRLKECEHVIICNLEFEGGRGPDVDGIQIKPNSKHIWIDRCSLKDYDDGLIDITRESTDITISRCHFSNHDKTMLIGADPSHHGDRCMRVTIHHCFFDGTRQRHPRVRFAKVHLYNNYTRNWGIYAVCASVESQIYSQCNIYEAAQKKVAFKYLTEKDGNLLHALLITHHPTSFILKQGQDGHISYTCVCVCRKEIIQYRVSLLE